MVSSSSPPSPTAASALTDSPGETLPYTVVSTATPALPLGTFAATSLSGLTAALTEAAGRAPRCPGGTCFAGATPPANSLLVLFAPSIACQKPNGYTITLHDTRLTVTAETTRACASNGGGGSKQVLDVLVAIPLDRLPHAATLTITSTGPMTPIASTTIALS